MEKEFKFELDGVQYLMTPSNAFTAWSALKKALKLVQGVDLSGIATLKDKKQIGFATLTTLLSNLDSPAVQAIEDMVLHHTTVKIGDDKPFRLSDRKDQHLNDYRHHLINLLVSGVKYQFGDFFKGGSGLLPSINLPEMN